VIHRLAWPLGRTSFGSRLRALWDFERRFFMTDMTLEYLALAALLKQSLKIADELALDLVAIRISEAIDQLMRETDVTP
jgi:hypothetical protein